MPLEPPAGFSNPLESEIIELEKLYAKGLAEGEVFEALKELRVQINILKSQLSEARKKKAFC